MITIKSKGIRRNKYLKEYFDQEILEDFTDKTKLAVVWGLDKNEVNKLAEEEAIKKNIPILRLEDGVFRSYSLTEDSYSLYKSKSGIYYNALAPSEFEDILNSNWQIKEYEEDYYNLCVELIRKYNISKYNDGKDFDLNKLKKNDNKNLLLIDQTYGDKSVEFGLGKEEDFSLMLNNALKREGVNVYIKIHPEVVIGKKQGYLLKEIEKLRNEDKSKIILLKDNENVPSIIEYMDEIHVVTSQVGFDALLRNKKVICYGVPFYSNWGITEDYKKIERRTKKRTIKDVFVVISLKLTEYINPFTKRRGELLDVLEYISLQKRHSKLKEVTFFKTKLWKKTVLEKFLFCEKSNFIKEERLLKNNIEVATWGYKEELQKIKNLISIEDGFLRSSGLGSDIEDPLSLVIDTKGIYFNPKKESDLEYMINNEVLTKHEKQIGLKLIRELTKSKVTKYNVGSELDSKNIKLENPKKKINLVVGQVEDDASIKLGSVSVKNDFELVEKVCSLKNGEVILYKPHPDVVSGNRKITITPEETVEKLQKKYPKNRIYLEKNGNIVDCFDLADEVHVITSTSGLEALLRNKKVNTYGLPFYGGYGLTNDMEKYPRYRRFISKEELAYYCYGIYPRYKLPKENNYTNALTIINFLAQIKNKKVEKTIINQFKRKIKLCIKTIQAVI